MDKKRRTKYQIAVYGVVGALGIILVFISLLFNWLPVWQSIWINLGTGLLGVGILFFLVDRFFLADEWGLSDRIDQLIRRLEASDRPSADAFFEQLPELDPYLRNAVQVDLCGVTLTGTVNKYFASLRERLSKGATVRILLADPDSLALEMSALRSDVPHDIDLFVKRLASTFKDLWYLHQFAPADPTEPLDHQQQASLSVRLLPYAPSFGIMRFQMADQDQVTIVELYPHAGAHRTAPVFMLRPERDKAWYEYFARQFDQMWVTAAPWEPQADLKDADEYRSQGTARASTFLTYKSHLPTHLLLNASEIHLLGMTLSRTTREYTRFVEPCLRSGGKVSVAILDERETVLDQLSQRTAGPSTQTHWRARLEGTRSFLEEIARVPGAKGTLLLGYLPFIPAFGLIVVDPKAKHGRIIVKMYHHRSSEDYPTFELRADRDREWFTFFWHQYELMWESCRIEKLPRSENP